MRCRRRAARVSFGELAERAHLSAQAVTALERRVRRSPYGDTVRLLAEALGFGGAERAAFEAAARYRGPFPTGFPSDAAGIGRATGGRRPRLAAVRAALRRYPPAP